MNTSGQKSLCISARYSLTRSIQAGKSRFSAVRTRAEVHFSASMPRSSRCPSSVLGKSLPPAKSAVPIPVPKVSMTTVPLQPRPAPQRISASPAASASLRNSTGRPSAWEASEAPSVPTQAASIFAAV